MTTTTIGYRWNLTDLASVPKNGRRVMSTFACGGGSSMGYKLAGFDVVAANDIDPEMARHYKTNLSPRHYFLCPVRDLVTAPLPDELFGIDLLDGSPPCSTFSTSGNREQDWGVEKHFREGQAVQVLSDLFFDFIAFADRLRPMAIVAENVKGMLVGNATGYTKLVMRGLERIGYRPQLFLVNAADCGVPQRRERVFFVALRNDINAPPLRLAPKERWISAGEALANVEVPEDEKRFSKKKDSVLNTLWPKVMPGESFAQHMKRNVGVDGKFFTHIKLDPSRPSCTLQSTSWTTVYHWREPRTLSIDEIKLLGSFPMDYSFETPNLGGYMIGMSVPPLMTRAVASAIAEQWAPLMPASGTPPPPRRGPSPTSSTTPSSSSSP